MFQDQISLAEFVLQEAREKCFEIDVKAFKHFEKDKKIIVDGLKTQIRDEFDTKMKRKEQQEKIKHSSVVNSCRLKKMLSRNQALMKIYSDSQYKVCDMIRKDENFYKQLLQSLIVQGLIKMFEHKVVIRCLQKDIHLVEAVISDAKKQFSETVKHELNGLDFPIEITVDKYKCLEERHLVDNSQKSVHSYSEEDSRDEVIKKTENDKKCFGGVLLTSEDGLIICKNTLDVRVEQTFQDSLPIIRSTLFGK